MSKAMKEVLNGSEINDIVVVEVDKTAELNTNKIMSDTNLTKIAYYHIQGFTTREIAEIMGVSDNAIKIAKRSEEFKSIVNSITAEIVNVSRTFLSTAGLKAVKTLVDCLESPNDRVRLQASTEILDRIGLKSPEKLEILTKADTIKEMSTEQLLQLIKTGMDEIVPIATDISK